MRRRFADLNVRAWLDTRLLSGAAVCIAAVALALPGAAGAGGGGFPWRSLPLCGQALAAKLSTNAVLLPKALEYSARADDSTALGLVADSYDAKGNLVSRGGPIVLGDDRSTQKLKRFDKRPVRWVVSIGARMLTDKGGCRAGAVVIVEKTSRGVKTTRFRCSPGARGSSKVLRCPLRRVD